MVLTNILPGIRQLRAPVAAGYLWLLFVYLVADLGDLQPRTGILHDFDTLGRSLSPVGLALAVSFGAYLIGSFSQWILRMLGGVIFRNEAMKLSTRGHGALEDLLAPLVATGMLKTVDEAKRLARAVLDDLDLIKTRLLGEAPELHGEVDRLHAEAEFRFAILPPLTAVAIVAGLQIPSDALTWAPVPAHGLGIVLLVLVLVETLCIQALGVMQEANDKLLDAVFLERVSSPALERWEREAAASV